MVVPSLTSGGSKGLGNYGGYETFVDKLTEYHQNDKSIKYHIACKANGTGAMDEKKLDGAETISPHHFKYHNAICYKVEIPEKLGSAQAIFYDCKSFAWALANIKRHHVQHPIVYILACRIGPFVGKYVRELHKLGGKCYVNPDGHEWMRAKWSKPVREYWKISEAGMVKHADLLICDSKNIEKYIREEYRKYNPRTTYIAYGADVKPSACEESKFEGWLKSKIIEYCESGDDQKRKCYAEKAFNEVSDHCFIYPLDVRNRLCNEIDNPEDLAVVSSKLAEIERRTVYMCFSTDIIHSGHIAILKKAAKLGKVIVGVMSDEAVASYKRFPLLPFSERKAMFENLSCVYKVVEQNTLSYKENLEKLHPDYVVHGDDWVQGFQKPVRDEVVSVLASYGGKLVEFPYSKDDKYKDIERRTRSDIGMPDFRRGRLKKAIEMKGLVNVMEAHDGLTGLVVENTIVNENGGARQFDAMWVSSLCDSTAKGKPDIELVDMTSRFRTIEDITEVTTKPIIFDGDTGGIKEHFVYTVRSLERLGVSMIIIEDKTGLKKNSLFGTEVKQTQDTIENFCEKIIAGKKAQRTKEFMICARCESLILEQGMDDALTRCRAYVKAGVDAIMIHSRKKDPAEIFTFIDEFRKTDKKTYLVVVPTSFNSVTEEEFKARGVNVVIYANQLMRAEVPAIQETAKSILEHHRAMEVDNALMPFKDIIRLIPEDN